MADTHRVVIVGGGFGGLNAALRLRKAPVNITLIDRRNFHLFQPLLYQVAAGGLSPANIAQPLRAVLRRQRNVKVLLGQVNDIDGANRRLVLGDDGTIEYDTLIIATGARHFYFGHESWEELAPGLKTIEDATEIRRRVLLAFERAEATTNPEERQALLTFVIVGAGPTGVELAGAIGDLANYTLRDNFRVINPAVARVLLLEGGDRVLPSFRPHLSAYAEKKLAQLGVTVLLKTMVEDVQPGAVLVRRGGTQERLEARTLLWAAGVKGSRLGQALHKSMDAPLDRAGRVQVQPDLTVPGHPDVFVIGDLACLADAAGRPLPGVAPVAMQQGRHVGRMIERRLAGQPIEPFRYQDKGNMATIGRNAAVADMGWTSVTGRLAWLAWLFIHILYLVGFQNRLLVLMQWGWNYLTRNRAARLITGG